MKALIIGAGIGGLTAGIALRRSGVEVAVFERRGDLSEIQIGGGIVLWSNAVRALQQLELADAVLDVGFKVSRAGNQSADGTQLFAIPVSDFEQALGAPSITISRANLHPVLEAALGPDVVRLNRECTGFEQDAGGVTARFADGSEERGDVLVGADGRNSRLRTQLGREDDRYPPYAGYALTIGVVKPERDPVPEGLFRIVTGRGWQLYFFHIGTGEVYWSAAVYGPEGARGREYDPTYRDEVLQRVRGSTPPIESLIAATDPAVVSRRDMHGGTPLPAWGEGRVTLLGDSAHPMTVTPGQGACTAIEDAVVLARCLQADSDPLAALRNYEALRKERSANWMSVSHSLESRVNITNPARAWIRNQIMGLALGRLGLIKRTAYYREMMRPI